MQSAVVEKDVENFYRTGISRERKHALWSSPYKIDGLATWGNVRLLLETKYQADLECRSVVCTIVGQVLLYIKKFEEYGSEIPNVILIGDRAGCILLETKKLANFLEIDANWKAAPSKGDPKLTRFLMDGLDALPFPVRFTTSFSFSNLIKEIEQLSVGSIVKTPVTTSNVSLVFTHWKTNVLKESRGKQHLNSSEKAEVFLKFLFDKDNSYVHPCKGTLVVEGFETGVLINQEKFKSFCDHFEDECKPSEIKQFIAIKDRLLDDETRRRQGAFFTPSIWAQEAQKDIAEVLGAKWCDDCVVWDCAAGTGNLTRDLKFTNLISSTIEKQDVDMMLKNGIGGQFVFQYDFLNPRGQTAVPVEVHTMLKDNASKHKRIVFFINPPYGTASTHKGNYKAGVADTNVNMDMKANCIGPCAQQLYAQFMYECDRLAKDYGFLDITIALFSKPTFLCSGSYRSFRQFWYDRYEYQRGFMFQASHFADVSGLWGVSFTIWNNSRTADPKQKILMRLCDTVDCRVVTTNVKQIYDSDDNEASKWIREPVKHLKTDSNPPQMTSGLKFKSKKVRGTLISGSLMYMFSTGNSMQTSSCDVALFSTAYANGNGVSVLECNWRRAVALFCARKLEKQSWVNDKDEYLCPDEEAPGYDQWVNDCHVYALFHPSNNCTSMRNVYYDQKNWDIQNNWFWKKASDAKLLLDNPKTADILNDCIRQSQQNSDPYFSRILSDMSLSEDSRRLLLCVDALWLKSLSTRQAHYNCQAITDSSPDLHMNAWDAGVYQLKNFWNSCYPQEWSEIKDLYKLLGGRLKEGVYSYGFLRR